MAEEQLKLVKAYIAKGDELKRAKPVVAYFCRMYAADLASQIKHPEARPLLVKLIPVLEQERSQFRPDQLEGGRGELECLALDIFERADKEYQGGVATKETAKKFRAAAVLMEITRYWGQMPEDMTDNYKYAKWKAVEIIKELAAGRQPMPPKAEDDFGGDVMNGGADGGGQQLDAFGLPLAPSARGAAYPPPQPANMYNPAPAPAYPPAPAYAPAPAPAPAYGYAPAPAPAPAPAYNPAPAYGPPPGARAPQYQPAPNHLARPSNLPPVAVMSEAEKYTRFALSAIQFDDVNEAVANLQKALQVLTTRR